MQEKNMGHICPMGRSRVNRSKLSGIFFLYNAQDLRSNNKLLINP